MDAFTAHLDRMAGELAPGRREAARRFLAQGLPRPDEEAWKYTRLSAIAKTPFTPAREEDHQALDAAAVRRLGLAAELPLRVVIVNGGLRRDLSTLDQLPAGMTLLAHADADVLAEIGDGGAPDRFVDLNTAFLSEVIVLDIAAGTVLDRAVHLIFVGARGSGPLLRLPRVVIRAGRGSAVHVVEEYVGTPGDDGLTTALTDIRLAEDAQVYHHLLQVEAEAASHIGRVRVEAGAGSTFHSDSVAFGAALARIDIDVRLTDTAARCRLNGLFVAGGSQHVDHHTRVDHLAGDTHSEELYRGILDDRARGVFNGKVVVHRGAQHISARQTSNNLLLSRHAEVDTKPELEIYADDVSCAHGATVGELDPAALFYLRSRGVGEREARALLTYAFAELVIRDIPLAGVREWIEHRFIGHGAYGELMEALG